MGLFNDVLANTVGPVWSAASGTVDPWTKEQIIEEEAGSVHKASGGSISQQDARQQAEHDVTTTLQTFQGPDGRVGADSSQFLDGVQRSIVSLGDKVKSIADVSSGVLIPLAILAVVAFAGYIIVATPAGKRFTA